MEYMANLPEIRKNRIEKLKKLLHAGLNPYPTKSRRTHQIAEVLKNFSKLEKKAEEVVIAGRVRTLRFHGGATFFDLEDGSGKIQVLFRKDKIGEKGYEFFKKVVDIGDFLEIKGTLMKTKTGEKTIGASDFNFLAKSLLPLPEKWHGLKDIEERYRKRYLDLLFSEEVRKKFERRSAIIKTLRDFLQKEGFLEVETPILQPIYGGAKARPFKTHLNALDLDLYLRISPELYLKRLIVGGFEKIYEIGKCFRNEGVDKSHNPDFTMLEFYWAYADYKEMMKLTEKMFSFLLKKVFGKLEIEYAGKKINFTPPWRRLEFFDFFQKETGLDLEELSSEGLQREAEKLGIEVEKGAQKAEIADKIFKKICQDKIWHPTFLLHHPLGAFPLAKTFEKNPKKLANFQVIVAGWELINAFSELNDPIEQRKRFEEQEKLYKKGLEEAQRMDEDFLTALEYGMPPAAGFGMGIDRLVALLTDSHSLREVILFPTMRPK
ncbi:MAG: lysine--tRNA ligase [Candidatus Nealsonbacteria bacterium]|nr:MAG: lysine--tRNA ligase [Candidatus Nealsonbacteria bacterium]